MDLDDDFGTGDRRKELRVVEEGRRRARKYEIGRQQRGRMLHLVTLLPTEPRAIMTMFLQGMTVPELAVVRRTSPRTMRRRIDRLHEMLQDKLFLAAAELGDSLPGELAKVARAYWLEGRALRELAAARGESLHRVRQVVAMARTLLAAGGLSTTPHREEEPEDPWAVQEDE